MDTRRSAEQRKQMTDAELQSKIMRVLMRLGRELRYWSLPVIGKRVVIETLDDVEHVLRQLVAPWITRDSTWGGCDIAGGLAKYGLVDRWCNVEARQLDGAMRGIRAQRASGVVREPYPNPECKTEARAFAAECLLLLADDLGRCVLKLFLNDDIPDELRWSRDDFERYRRYGAGLGLEDYFPRPFIVTDACITNAPLIWLDKHFYM
jgi:hypothetical protein